MIDPVSGRNTNNGGDADDDKEHFQFDDGEFLGIPVNLGELKVKVTGRDQKGRGFGIYPAFVADGRTGPCYRSRRCRRRWSNRRRYVASPQTPPDTWTGSYAYCFLSHRVTPQEAT